MDLYFTLCGALCILTAFGVLDKILKANKINKFFAVMFFALTCIFSVVDPVNIFGVLVNFNAILYTLVFTAYIFTIKSMKGYFSFLLCTLVVIAVLVSYNAFDTSAFDYNYLKPYVYVSIFAGILLYYLSKNFKSCFCGLLFGSLVFEGIVFKTSVQKTYLPFSIGMEITFVFAIVSMIVFCVLEFIKICIKNKKAGKQAKVNN